jgi:hypothetical protein
MVRQMQNTSLAVFSRPASVLEMVGFVQKIAHPLWALNTSGTVRVALSEVGNS